MSNQFQFKRFAHTHTGDVFIKRDKKGEIKTLYCKRTHIKSLKVCIIIMKQNKKEEKKKKSKTSARINKPISCFNIIYYLLSLLCF